MQITLPVSKCSVEIRDTITFSEFQEIDNFFKNRMKVQIVDGSQKTEIDGIIDQQMEEKMVQTYLQSCRGAGNEEISTVGFLGRLDAEDGMTLKNIIAEKFDELKKKLTPTKKK